MTLSKIQQYWRSLCMAAFVLLLLLPLFVVVETHRSLDSPTVAINYTASPHPQLPVMVFTKNNYTSASRKILMALSDNGDGNGEGNIGNGSGGGDGDGNSNGGGVEGNVGGGDGGDGDGDGSSSGSGGISNGSDNGSGSSGGDIGNVGGGDGSSSGSGGISNGSDNGSGSSGGGGDDGSMNRIGMACSKENIVIFQGPTTPLPNGIPTYTVQVQNVCVSGRCSISNIHLTCGWFSSARLINPRVFRRIYYDDCLVNNGGPMTPGETLSFQYANSFEYPLSVSSVAC